MPEQKPDNTYWTIHFDGSRQLEGSGAGVVLTSPRGDKFCYVLRLMFPCTNNAAEYEALLLFAENPGRNLHRDFLVESLRGIRWQTYDRSIDVLVSRLRIKLGDTPTKTNYIKTVHGVGYMFIGELQNKK